MVVRPLKQPTCFHWKKSATLVLSIDALVQDYLYEVLDESQSFCVVKAALSLLYYLLR